MGLKSHTIPLYVDKEMLMRTVLGALSIALLVGCGGGGGGTGGGACDALKIAGGESCSGQGNVALVLGNNPREGKIENCTGAYVSLTSVLTAAHCFPGVTEVVVASKGNLRKGVRVFIHPLYNGSVGSPFDMAIVRVDQPLEGAGPVPILLSRSPAQGESVVVYGYGLDESGNLALDRIQSGEEPLKATVTTYVGFEQGTDVVVSTGAGSTCGGDSGGPFLAKDDRGQYGIFGITRAGPAGCGAPEGRPSALSSTQTNGAINFLTSVVPDLAVN